MADLFAGTLDNWETQDSMAKDMETALGLLMGGLPSAPQKLVDDRRKFLSLSQTE